MYPKEIQESWDELKKHLQKGEELHSEYAKKRTGYLDSIKNEQNRTLNKKLMLAAIATDVCLNVYLDYLAAIANNFTELGEKLNNHNALFSNVDKALFTTLESSQAKLFSAMKETSNVSLVQALKADVESVISTLQSRIIVSDNIESVMLFKFYTLNITTLYIYSTLIELLKTKDSKVALEVLMVLVKFIVGLVPFADYPLLAMDLKDAIELKQKQVSTTSDVLNQLDDFYFASFNWCMVVHIIMDLLDNSFLDFVSSVNEKKVDPEILNKSAEKVKARFDKIWKLLSMASAQ
jgi:hypothetical protein